jgi:hypothetical protein
MNPAIDAALMKISVVALLFSNGSDKAEVRRSSEHLGAILEQHGQLKRYSVSSSSELPKLAGKSGWHFCILQCGVKYSRVTGSR